MKFDLYFEPTTVEECVELLNEYKNVSKILAGGTDLVVNMRNNKITPKVVISLNMIPELARCTAENSNLHIGAVARIMELSRWDKLTGYLDVLKKGCASVSTSQVRNMATIGGNVCNASPSADTIPALMVCDATVDIVSASGTKTVPVDQFFTGPGKTVLKENEIITGFNIPILKEKNGAAYKKFTIRGTADITIVGVGARIELDKDGVVKDSRLVLASVAPTPVRITTVEKLIAGKKLDEELIEQAAKLAATECSPITDARATKEYRKEMVRVWTKHVLKEANIAAINS